MPDSTVLIEAHGGSVCVITLNRPASLNSFSAEAERIGLVWQCVDDAVLLDTALALAVRLAALPSRALVETRRTLDAALAMDFGDAITQEADAQRELGRAHDFAEGVAAFRAKRLPRFSDRSRE